MTKIAILASLFAAFLSAGFPVARAAEIRLDGAGFDVIYDDALVGLFGTPSLLGNTLVFSPTSFSALSTAGSWAFTNATIGLTLVADAGRTLTGASLVERGDYLRFGSGGTVFAAGQTSAYDFRTPNVETTATISGAEPAVLTLHDLPVITNWQANSAQVFAPGATNIHFTIENLLAANAGGVGDFAFIEKKYLALTVSAVPEASQYAMFLVGLGLFAGLYRRVRAN